VPPAGERRGRVPGHRPRGELTAEPAAMKSVLQGRRIVLAAAPVLLSITLGLGGAVPPAEASSLPGAGASAWSRRIIQGGIAIQAEIAPLDPARQGRLVEEQSVAVRFTITDAATGQPLGGLNPAAWLDLVSKDQVAPDACKHDVESFVGGSLLKKPELDLNVYFVLAMNQDATINVVDPLFGFGGSRLLALIDLLSPGEDWVLSADQKRLFVSQPDAGRVAAVDTASWKVEAQLDAGPRPTRVALQPDGGYVWVTLDPAGKTAAGSGVAVLDPRELRVVARIPTGAGRHEVAFSDDSRFAFVTNGDAGTVSVIDVRELRKVKDLATGKQPASIAWSALAKAAYVTHAGDGTIVAIGGTGHEVTARVPARPGLGQIRFAPGGRLGFAVNPPADALFIIDVATNQILQSGEMQSRPDQIAFTDDLAYIRHLGSETVLMIPLKEVGVAGKPVPAADFPGGQNPFGRGKRPSPAAGIVRAPGKIAVLVANPADQVIYYYKEGMAAPMGSFQNYDREPRAVLVVDRSLGERSRAGTYETVAKLGRPGRHELALFLDSPRVVHCFDLEVHTDPALEEERRRAKPAAVKPLVETSVVRVGETVRLGFRFADPNTGAPLRGLTDVQVQIHRSDVNWQDRRMAHEVEAGLYEVDFVPTEPADYVVRVQSPAGRLPLHLSPRMIVRATEARAGASP
jgi:DNA-binding beta-propeller fold protein YncE